MSEERTGGDGWLGAPVVGSSRVTGGDVGSARRVELADGRVLLVKTYEGPDADAMIATEAAGLRWLGQGVDGLAAGGVLLVPAVVATQGPALALEWLEAVAREPAHEEALGRGLAHLHAAGAPSHGWSPSGRVCLGPLEVPAVGREDGSREDGSREDGSGGDAAGADGTGEDGAGAGEDAAGAPEGWAETWRRDRLAPLVRRARDVGGLDAGGAAALERLGERAADLLGPAVPPARLHGDLWWGNVLPLADGRAALVDPAAHGGPAEVDLAMLALFGPLPDRLVAAYQDVSTLPDGWRDRLPLHQVTPLLVHAALFGGSYGARAVDVARRHG